MQRFRRIFASALVLSLVPLASAVADTAEDEAAIRAALADWLAASMAKDAEAFASVYAADAVLMLEGAPDIAGQEAIAGAVAGLMQDPNFELTFEADRVEVAAAGDLAIETGTYRFALSDPEGNPAAQVGHYVVVWRKQADGTWKVAIDAPISDPAEAPPGE